MLHVFNEINCRKLSMYEVNVFKNFFNNWMFQAIFWGTFVIQILIVEFGGEFISCSKLSIGIHLVCIGLGISGLVFGIMVRLVVSMCRNKELKGSSEKNQDDDGTKFLDDNLENYFN